MPNSKTVERFILSSNSCSVDLADAPTAIEVSLPDGLITFREGFGPGRIHGWVLTPNAVQKFTVDRIDGKYGIILQHKRRGVDAQHFIGFVKDVPAAEAWIVRVNKIYQKLGEEREQRIADRTTEYRDYPVVNDILETKVNIVLPGAYQYSFRKYLPRKKLCIWEQAYIDRCMELLARETGVNKNSIEVDVRGFIPHDYEWLSDRVMYDAEHYESRITQPLELIFDREQRHDRIMVNPFCYTQSFALVYFKNSRIKNTFGLQQGKQVTTTFEDFLDIFRERAEERQILLCAPAKQSVYYAFYDAHLAGRFDLYRHFHKRYGIDGVAVWLWQNAPCGLVACDVGEVYPLSTAITQFQGLSNDTPLEYSIVPYDKQVPIGYCYRCDDEMWGEIGRQSLLDIREHPQSIVRSNFKSFQRRVNKIDIKVAA